MSDFQTEMNRVVAGFVAQITELARAAARDMIDEALGKGGKVHSRLRWWPVGSSAAVAVPSARSDELDKLADRLPRVRRQAPGSAHRADQQAARHDDQGPRAADPQADRGRRAQDQGRRSARRRTSQASKKKKN